MGLGRANTVHEHYQDAQEQSDEPSITTDCTGACTQCGTNAQDAEESCTYLSDYEDVDAGYAEAGGVTSEP